jgi:F-type H+-transporting ATPase subunit a
MPQPHSVETTAEAAKEGGNIGQTIVEHVSNSSLDHPLIHLPKILGIDMSVTKHVLMLWVVAALVLLIVSVAVRRYLRQDRMVPSGFMNALEFLVEYIRDEIVRPNVGNRWVNTWTPLLLTLFLFILCANLIGLIPIFEVVLLANHYVLHPSSESFLSQVTHGGSTATGNFNVTAGLATVTFFAIIIAGSKAHGFFKHWKNMVPHGVNPVVTWALLIPIEIIGMFVRPFALTMRLAANMTGGHVAILAVLAMIFIMAESARSTVVGLGMSVIAVPLAVGISVLEAVVVVPVQAFVFTLLTAVFVGMAIHAHH